MSLSQGLAGWPEGVKALKVCEALSLFAQQSGLAGDLKVLNGDTLRSVCDALRDSFNKRCLWDPCAGI